MNPFEYFQKLKPDIESQPDLMNNLRAYAFTDRIRLIGEGLLECAGIGVNNTHFRIGKIEAIWLATREYIAYAQDQPPDTPKEVAEMYIQQLIKASAEGKRVPILCGGVIAREKSGIERYFMVTEDLTAGGTVNFEPGKRGKLTGTIDGQEMFHDFDDLLLKTGQDYKFMLEDRVILLQE